MLLVKTSKGKPYWWLGGWLNLIVGNNPENKPPRVQRAQVPLNYFEIIEFPLDIATPTYSLIFQPVFWLPDITLVCYQYQETIN